MGFFSFIAIEEMVNFPIALHVYKRFLTIVCTIEKKKSYLSKTFGGESNVMETDLKG